MAATESNDGIGGSYQGDTSEGMDEICIPISDFDFGSTEILGRGAFGNVYLVTDKIRNRRVVMKASNQESNQYQTAGQTFLDEFRIMRKIRMHYSVEVYGLVEDHDGQICGFVMEHVRLGSLFDVVQKLGKAIPRALQLRVLYQTADAMKYLHAEKILHLDLKTPNLLLDKKCKVKVTDFGLSKVRSSIETAGITTTSQAEREPGGTEAFIAPEVLEHPSQEPSRKHDVYAYGITMWEVLTGLWPYKYRCRGDTTSFSLQRVIDGRRPDVRAVPQETTQDVIDIMQACWNGEPELRPQFAAIVPKLQPLSDEVGQQACKDAEDVRRRLGVEKNDDSSVATAMAEMTTQEEAATLGAVGGCDADHRPVVGGVHSIVDSHVLRNIMPSQNNTTPNTTKNAPSVPTPSDPPPSDGAGGDEKEETPRHKRGFQTSSQSFVLSNSLNLTQHDHGAGVRDPGAAIGPGVAIGAGEDVSIETPHNSMMPSLYVQHELAVVSDHHLVKLAPYIEHRWQDFAHHLTLTPEDLAEIAASTPIGVEDGEVLRVIQGLLRWKQMYGDQACRKWILCILVHMRMHEDLSPILDAVE